MKIFWTSLKGYQKHIKNCLCSMLKIKCPFLFCWCSWGKHHSEFSVTDTSSNDTSIVLTGDICIGKIFLWTKPFATILPMACHSSRCHLEFSAGTLDSSPSWPLEKLYPECQMCIPWNSIHIRTMLINKIKCVFLVHYFWSLKKTSN